MKPWTEFAIDWLSFSVHKTASTETPTTTAKLVSSFNSKNKFFRNLSYEILNIFIRDISCLLLICREDYSTSTTTIYIKKNDVNQRIFFSLLKRIFRRWFFYL